MGNTVNVEGWAGTVTTTFLSSNMLGLHVYIYTSLLSQQPWIHAVQPSYNPAGSNIWYVDLGKVAAGNKTYAFNNVCNFQRYDTSGYATYDNALNPILRISEDNMYVQVGEASMWLSSPAILRISTVLKL